MSTRNLNILNKFSILYLEDDESLLTHTKDILDDFVHHVHSVRTSAEAIEVLKNHHIDVIISDILLENENGIDFLKKIKTEMHIELPTVLTTAHTDTKYLLEAIKLKVENYIVKPINVKDLLNTLHDILLPTIQKSEIQKNAYVIKTISAVTDSKQVDVVRYIIANLDEDHQLHSSYTDIMEQINISKPTLIKLFKALAEKGILTKTAHKTYQFNEVALESIYD